MAQSAGQQQQPPWTQPTSVVDVPVLRVYNSLTRTKNEFVPREGRRVKWYNCGPTVYDASHMGHARNYVTQDVLRRIVSDYFGYDVHFVMNITDIEDKIILRARQNHLLDRFRAETTTLCPALLDEIRAAWTSYVRSKVAKGLAPADVPAEGAEWDAWPALETKFKVEREWRQDNLKRDEKFEMHFAAAAKARSALEVGAGALESRQAGVDVARQLIDEASDVLAPALDARLGPTVTDPSISRKLSAYWERRFFEDMARLRVRAPDTVTRVTEYVPEIVAFVEGIVRNGYAYEHAGSVYFDTRAFDAAPNHVYAKLEPWSRGDMALLEEGEGALSGSGGGKRAPADFALWKASKPGEPAWDSPWGPGRPGWHIECSVMASAVLGSEMDIHSGGVDLAFPHHDNEVAQSEAFHECGNWVNYFLHTGHLHIEGLKMSKSLKNFITIDEILGRYSARQLRLGFISQLWNSKVDFSESLMSGEVKTIEATFNNFFAVVKAIVGRARAGADSGAETRTSHGYDEPEKELTAALHASQDAFRAALCDSFNTPQALDVLRDLVSRANVYINARGPRAANAGVVERVARWVGDMLRMFGLGEGDGTGKGEIGWGMEREEGSGAVDREEVLTPYLLALSAFRDDVRARAIKGGDGMAKDILALCDRLRDEALVPLGVALDDQEDGKALVKLVPPAELIKARDEKRTAAEAKAAQKAASAEAERQKRLAKLERGRVPPSEMFKPPNVPEGRYSAWDEAGVPILDGEGKEVSKSAKKGFGKDMEKQRKAHEEFLAWRKSEEGVGRSL